MYAQYIRYGLATLTYFLARQKYLMNIWQGFIGLNLCQISFVSLSLLSLCSLSHSLPYLTTYPTSLSTYYTNLTSSIIFTNTFRPTSSSRLTICHAYLSNLRYLKIYTIQIYNYIYVCIGSMNSLHH